ncbi:MAG TPA: hypothetical protein VIZ28_09925 [Chitinophagaceae bacterium]
MERNNNTYGDLINNKFSELLSPGMETTWKEMKDILDREMPEKKKRKWFLWFTGNAWIISVVLLSIFASATGAYIGSQRNQDSESIPVKDQKPSIKIESNTPQNEENIIENTGRQELAVIAPEETGASLHSDPERSEQINYTERIQTAEQHKAKLPGAIKIASTKSASKKDTVAKNAALIGMETKDSVSVSVAQPKTEVTERRAF